MKHSFYVMVVFAWIQGNSLIAQSLADIIQPVNYKHVPGINFQRVDVWQTPSGNYVVTLGSYSGFSGYERSIPFLKFDASFQLTASYHYSHAGVGYTLKNSRWAMAPGSPFAYVGYIVYNSVYARLESYVVQVDTTGKVVRRYNIFNALNNTRCGNPLVINNSKLLFVYGGKAWNWAYTPIYLSVVDTAGTCYKRWAVDVSGVGNSSTEEFRVFSGAGNRILVFGESLNAAVGCGSPVGVISIDTASMTAYLHSYGMKQGSLQGTYYHFNTVKIDDTAFVIVGSGAPSNCYGTWKPIVAQMVMLNGDGSLKWSKYYDGPGDDLFMGAVYDRIGKKLLLLGETNSWGQGSGDMFLVLVDSTGTVLKASVIGTPAYEGARNAIRVADGWVIIGTGYNAYNEGVPVVVKVNDSLLIQDTSCVRYKSLDVTAQVNVGSSVDYRIDTLTMWLDTTCMDIPIDTPQDAGFVDMQRRFTYPQLNFIIDSALCFGDSGVVVAELNGANAPYLFTWFNGDTTSSLPDTMSLPANLYWATVIDSIGCRDSLIFLIEQPPLLQVVLDSIKHNPCNGDARGEIYVSAEGGTPGYSYQWNTGATTSSITNLPADTYSVVVTDAHNCVAYDTFLITEPSPLTLTIDSVDSVRCHGESSGAIYITVSGGTMPYTYQWNTGDTVEDLTGIDTGKYWVVVDDANNCGPLSDTTYVHQPDSPLTVSISLSATNLMANASGGTPPYSYLWNTGSTSDTISPAASGTYWVVVFDANGCQASDTLVYTYTDYEDSKVACRVNIYPSHIKVLCHGNSINTRQEQVSLVDVTGRTVSSCSFNNNVCLLKKPNEGIYLLILPGQREKVIINSTKK